MRLDVKIYRCAERRWSKGASRVECRDAAPYQSLKREFRLINFIGLWNTRRAILKNHYYYFIGPSDYPNIIDFAEKDKKN